MAGMISITPTGAAVMVTSHTGRTCSQVRQDSPSWSRPSPAFRHLLTAMQINRAILPSIADEQACFAKIFNYPRVICNQTTEIPEKGRPVICGGI